MPPKPPHRHWCPRRDWRSLLPNLARMVPWPDGGGGPRTEIEVLENVLGYIRYLQRSVSVTRGGTDHPGDGDTVEGGRCAGATQSPPGQQLVPYEEEEVGESDSPWFCPTGPYWEPLDSDGGVTLLSPPRRWEGLLGLSPSPLASPPPPGSPGEVVRDLFADVYLSPQGTRLSPQAPAVSPWEAAAGGSPVAPRVAVGPGDTPQGQGGPPKKKCLNGFIMFCRLNRKAYISAHPGLASTTATRELAQLWHSLSPAERRPYCQRARRFSRQHDRVVRLVGDKDKDGDEDGDSDTDPPAPLQLLLAAHAGALGGGPLPP